HRPRASAQGRGPQPQGAVRQARRAARREPPPRSRLADRRPPEHPDPQLQERVRALGALRPGGDPPDPRRPAAHAMTTRRGRIAPSAPCAGAVALLVVELALGALHFGSTKLADPCVSKPAFSGGGIDGAIQRFALEGLNGAACKLGTTREALVLSFVPST